MNFKTNYSLALILSLSSPFISSVYAQPVSQSAAQIQSESKIFGNLIILNDNEIAAGNLANSKSTNQSVKNFAELMVKEHTENLNTTQEIANTLGVKPVEDKSALKLKDKGEKELKQLDTLQGSAFDKAYIKAMIKGHKEALRLVNHLINKSNNPTVKAHLKKTKLHVEQHLLKAQDIKKSLY